MQRQSKERRKQQQQRRQQEEEALAERDTAQQEEGDKEEGATEAVEFGEEGGELDLLPDDVIAAIAEQPPK